MGRSGSTAALAAVVCLAAWVPGCGPVRVAAPGPDEASAAALRETLQAKSGPPEAAAGAGPTGTGWATLTGRFVFAGQPGEPQPLLVDKDLEVCAKDGMKLYDRSLRVDPASKGLADVVLFVRKASRVKNPIPAEPVLFDQKNCEFLSPVVAVRVGQPLDVRNSDTVGHNTNISGTSFNQLIPAEVGTIYKPTAETASPAPVTCNIHPWMKAYVIFRKDGYVAVTATNGSFTIPDLPAGEPLEFQVWHPKAGSGLKLDRPELKWSAKGRFTITLQPDEVKDLGTLEVPASALGG